VVNQEPRIGDLRIEERLDAELHRYVRPARLFDIDSAICEGPVSTSTRHLRLSACGHLYTGRDA
jgi:hypothetical protein